MKEGIEMQLDNPQTNDEFLDRLAEEINKSVRQAIGNQDSGHIREGIARLEAKVDAMNEHLKALNGTVARHELKNQELSKQYAECPARQFFVEDHAKLVRVDEEQQRTRGAIGATKWFVAISAACSSAGTALIIWAAGLLRSAGPVVKQ